MLAKVHADRTPPECDFLVKSVVQFPFAKQRKIKEKDCREMITGMRLQKVTPGANIVTQGDEADAFYIIVDGNCSVWLPMLHVTSEVKI